MVVVGCALVSVVGLTACGSDSSSGTYVEPTGPPVKTFQISAANFSYTPNKLTAPAGILQVDLKSTDGLHDFVIQGVPGFQIEVTSGNSTSGKVKLKAGKYTFYCDLPGHRQKGMEGTLTVT